MSTNVTFAKPEKQDDDTTLVWAVVTSPSISETISPERLANYNIARMTMITLHREVENRFDEFVDQIKRDVLRTEGEIDLLRDAADRSTDPIVLLVDGGLNTTTRIFVDWINTVDRTVTFAVENLLSIQDNSFTIDLDAIVEGTPENSKAVTTIRGASSPF